MKWLLVLVAINLYPDGSAEHYILTSPTFDSLEQCQQEARVNHKKVKQLALDYLGGPAKVYCFDQDNLKEYIEQNAVGGPTTPSKKHPI
jgi:hypothetical protein